MKVSFSPHYACVQYLFSISTSETHATQKPDRNRKESHRDIYITTLSSSIQNTALASHDRYILSPSLENIHVIGQLFVFVDTRHLRSLTRSSASWCVVIEFRACKPRSIRS
uniref:AlNc14C33G3039 protein n=1 Tax=Albugo laibachii Nc14 TaxID=890382 RepID=F0W879_9STRA|nr:AlNc14C33G3039 [Albugo laibachii Nc14]|eukprot:CCA17363.1 AlNc14C33G3039 [Albugo laibachii Nc14]